MSSHETRSEEDAITVGNQTTESAENDEDSLLSSDSIQLHGWRSYIGILFALAASAQFSMGLLVAKLLLNIHPFMIIFWRFLGMTPIIPFVVYLCLGRKKPIFNPIWPVRGHAKPLFLLFCVCNSFSIGGALLIYSLHYITLADAATLTYSTPVFVALVSHWTLHEKTGIVPVLCGIIALTGVVVITRPPIFTGQEKFDTDVLMGSGLAFASMICGVVSYVSLRGLRHVHFSVILVFIAIYGTILGGILAVSVSRFEIPQNLHDWLLVGALAILYLVPQICLTLAFQFEEAGTVSLFRTFDILFAFVWQYFLMGVEPDWISILGGSVVVFGVLLASLRKYVAAAPLESRIRGILGFILV